MSSKICFMLLQISSNLFLITFIKNNFFICKSCQDDHNIVIMPVVRHRPGPEWGTWGNPQELNWFLPLIKPLRRTRSLRDPAQTQVWSEQVWLNTTFISQGSRSWGKLAVETWRVKTELKSNYNTSFNYYYNINLKPRLQNNCAKNIGAYKNK
jgi:hypothetical protein